MTPENIAGMAFLNGLQAVALTDHNSCRNCEAFLHALKKYDIFGICGMELTTSEEVHVLCLFPSLADAMDFNDYVEAHTMPFPNVTAIFGNQYLYEPGDQLVGEYDNALINATRIRFCDVPDAVKMFHGIHIPAHLDRHSNSLLSNLGFVPEDSRFAIYELHDMQTQAEILSHNPSLSKLRCITNSDAHTLTALKDSNTSPLTVPELSFDAIFQ